MDSNDLVNQSAPGPHSISGSLERRLQIAIAFAVAFLAALVFATSGRAQEIETVIAFDPAQGQLPEGLAADLRGNVYVGLATTGEIRVLAPDGSQSTLATLAAGAGFLVGLAVDSAGTVYAGLASFDPATHGIWRIRPDGSSSRVFTLPPDTLPNALAFDPRGDLFVTDSIGGGVWKLPRHGEPGQWVGDPLLVGNPDDPSFPFPIGANGIVFARGGFFVANSQRGRIVHIPMNADGTAANPLTFVEDQALLGADGLAVDGKGNLYVANNAANTLLRVDKAGTIETLATAADGLEFPASLAFGQTPSTRKNLYITNFALSTMQNPALLLHRNEIAGVLACPPGSFSWFQTCWGAGQRGAFEAELRRRGVDFDAWAERHPNAAAQLGAP